MNYTLREIELSDIETVNSWRSDPELIGHLLAPVPLHKRRNRPALV